MENGRIDLARKHAELVRASKAALVLLMRIQSDVEGNPMPMPWYEIDALETALGEEK